ncbi:MAG TPA: fumarylacetoacetate hydrolase family protein [Steroidobacteraceae bacterium]|nr:fumarylacetoacetate hydrolase family protein [Steroidobacteraceae bacterium]
MTSFAEPTGVSARFALGTFSIAGGETFPGIVVGDRVLAFSALGVLLSATGSEVLCNAPSLLAVLERWEENEPLLSRAAESIQEDTAGTRAHPLTPLEAVRVHAPVLPRQIFCSGANYRKHVIDLIIDQPSPQMEKLTPQERRSFAEKVMDERAAHGKPFVFTKIASSVTGPFDPIVLPYDVRQPDWELELGVVIGKAARRVKRMDALGCVAGYVIVNDITSRDLVYRRDVPQMGMDWLACKSAPTFLPVGPYLVPSALVPDPQNLQITLKLNGEIKQDERTADMIFDVAQLIEHISSYVQLLPGDLICTGSPAGNGTHYDRYLRDGDVLEGSISGLGTQTNACVAERTGEI